MDVRTGSKSWGYSKRPKNWKKIMYQDLPEVDEIDESHESEARIPEIEDIKPEDVKPEDEMPEGEARIEKPKITATVTIPLVDPDSSFSYI